MGENIPSFVDHSIGREELAEEIEQLHKVLDFYADAINWIANDSQSGLKVIQVDAGNKAREALFQSRKRMWRD